MELYIRIIIQPTWADAPSTHTEARERGKLRVEMLDLAQEFEDKIKEMLEARDG